MDLDLPDSKGLALCDQIKFAPRLQGLPVIVLTASSATQLECLRHEAVHRVLKDGQAEEMLAAVLQSILKQQDRAQGRIDAGDVTLIERELLVLHEGRPLAQLEAGPFAALRALIERSPEGLSELEVYAKLICRRSYEKRDPELAIRSTVRNYLSRLRGALGKIVGPRIVFVPDSGYTYTPPKPLPCL